MRLLLPYLICFLLSATQLKAQQRFIDPDLFEETTKSSLNTEELKFKLDSLQRIIRNPVHAYYIEFKSNLKQAHRNTYTYKTIYTWKFNSKYNFGLRVFIKKLKLTNKDSLLIYDHSGFLFKALGKQDIIGSNYSSEVMPNGLIIQLISHSKKAKLEISGFSIEFLQLQQSKSQNFGDSENCQVNVNCSEGEDFQNVKRSVVRILAKVGNGFVWCTGSLVNNVRYDYSPYLLTAEHCAILNQQIASQSDLDLWTFFFNFESNQCSNPPSGDPFDDQRITGATILANSNDNGGDSGSDFLLLRLSSSIPASFNAYYAGWNNQVTDIPLNGASIHHPSGDIKKISTYTSPATSDTYNNLVSDTHWKVNWSATVNGHGTTEGGSSGSPLYDEDNLIRGALTGGASSCGSTEGPDYYGKFGYSWNNNGTTPDRRLDYWLDPDGLGYKALNGANLGDIAPFLSRDINIYPIPVSGQNLVIRDIGLPQDDITISLHDTHGKLLYKEKTVAIPGENTLIDIRGLVNGFYMLILQRNSDLIRKKILIMNNP